MLSQNTHTDICEHLIYYVSTMFPDFRTQRIALGEGLYRPVSINDFGSYAQIQILKKWKRLVKLIPLMFLRVLKGELQKRRDKGVMTQSSTINEMIFLAFFIERG